MDAMSTTVETQGSRPAAELGTAMLALIAELERLSGRSA